VEHPAIRRTPLTVADIERVAQHQGVTFRQGDILIIRTGWTEWYNNSTEEERAAGTQGNEHIGLVGTEETVKWLWSRHFAAVASDSLAFEAWPTRPPYSMTLHCFMLRANEPRSANITVYSLGLHDWLLAMWGTPIGELWDLEKLAENCARCQRWSFFLTSAPLNIKGGIASPPNAMAIF
jgi:kynurenine formamidase